MKTMKTIHILATSVVLVFGINSAMAAGQENVNKPGQSSVSGPGAIVSQLPYEELSQEEKDGLLKMREEEKLARDVYIYLYDLWRYPVFSNISHAEQRHMDAVGILLARYNLVDPADGMGPGQFNSPEMQDLYNSLTEKGSASLEDAFYVGATIEDLDIKDLEELIGTADNEDVLTVYQNLLKGSRNHMRAFGSRLAALGVNYQAQFLSQEEVDAIISSPKERGRADKDGSMVSRPQGKGSGPKFMDMDGDGICDNMKI